MDLEDKKFKVVTVYIDLDHESWTFKYEYDPSGLKSSYSTIHIMKAGTQASNEGVCFFERGAK